MAKIFSILTLLIAAGAAYLAMESNKLVDKLQAKGQENFDGWQRTKKDLTDTKATLKTTQETLAKTEEDLKTERANLATARDELAKAKTELATATAAKDTAEKALADIKTQIQTALPGIDLSEIAKIPAMITEMTNKVKELEAT